MFYYITLFLLYSSQLIIYTITEHFPNIGPLLQVQKNPWSRAVFDNFIHFSHAFLCMLTFCLQTDAKYLQEFCKFTTHKFVISVISNSPLICGVFASAIDIDHFLSARSLSIKDATSLSQRPPFHCTTAMLLLPITIFILNYFEGNEFYNKIGFCLLIAITTHHLRDGLRRGLWIFPFKSTSRVPHWFYLTFLMLFPHICSFCNSLRTLNVKLTQTVDIV